METMILADGYARTKVAPTATYRRMTVYEAKRLTYGAHVPFLANDGTARTCKVNGKPQTWKTRPGHVRVPLKYGMYECGDDFVQAETEGAPMGRLLVRVDDSSRPTPEVA